MEKGRKKTDIFFVVYKKKTINYKFEFVGKKFNKKLQQKLILSFLHASTTNSKELTSPKLLWKKWKTNIIILMIILKLLRNVADSFSLFIMVANPFI